MRHTASWLILVTQPRPTTPVCPIVLPCAALSCRVPVCAHTQGRPLHALNRAQPCKPAGPGYSRSLPLCRATSNDEHSANEGGALCYEAVSGLPCGLRLVFKRYSRLMWSSLKKVRTAKRRFHMHSCIRVLLLSCSCPAFSCLTRGGASGRFNAVSSCVVHSRH